MQLYFPAAFWERLWKELQGGAGHGEIQQEVIRPAQSTNYSSLTAIGTDNAQHYLYRRRLQV